MRITGTIRHNYETLLKNIGEVKFYRRVLGSGVIAAHEMDHPEIMMLDQAEDFFSLYRQTGNNNYFTIGKILRRASHKLYREFARKGGDFPRNARFLNIVK
jgi:hypothetical protein